jgi:hypothetical protein
VRPEDPRNNLTFFSKALDKLEAMAKNFGFFFDFFWFLAFMGFPGPLRHSDNTHFNFASPLT